MECVGIVGCRVTVFCGLGVASYPQPPDRSPHRVLWVLTGTHPCGTSTQAGWWRYQSASSYVRQCWCWCCCTRGRDWSWSFYHVELSVIRTPPRTISRALSFDLGTVLSRSSALTLSSWELALPLSDLVGAWARGYCRSKAIAQIIIVFLLQFTICSKRKCWCFDQSAVTQLSGKTKCQQAHWIRLSLLQAKSCSRGHPSLQSYRRRLIAHRSTLRKPGQPEIPNTEDEKAENSYLISRSPIHVLKILQAIRCSVT